jgi:predicted transcriptional regulator
MEETSLRKTAALPKPSQSWNAGRAVAADLNKHAYTIQEVAALMGLSRQTVTRLFEDEAGVIVIKRPEKMHKRSLRTIRIPRAVFERVVRSLTV